MSAFGRPPLEPPDEHPCDCPPGWMHKPDCHLVTGLSFEDRQRVRAAVDKAKREAIARSRGLDVHVPAWDDEEAWAEVEKP